MILQISQSNQINLTLRTILKNIPQTAFLAQDQQKISLLTQRFYERSHLLQTFVIYLQVDCGLLPSIIFKIIKQIVPHQILSPFLKSEIYKAWLQFKMFEILNILKASELRMRARVYEVFSTFQFQNSNLTALINQCCNTIKQQIDQNDLKDIQLEILEDGNQEKIFQLFQRKIIPSQISYNRQIHIKLVGNNKVGKTSIILKYIDGVFNQHNNSSLRVDMVTSTTTQKSQVINMDGVYVELTLWDAVGHGRYSNTSRSFYKGSDGIIIVYDITNSQSFDSLPDWLKQIDDCSSEQTFVLLVGNKSDLKDHRRITFQKARHFAKQMKKQHIEVSAKTSANIIKAFDIIVRGILQGKKSQISNQKKPSLILNQAESSYIKQKKTCC